MKKIFPSIVRGALILIGTSLSAAAENEPALAVSAEVWRFDIPEGISSKVVFEQWRAQRPAGEPQILALDGLTIPAREASTMVRVGGVLTAPVTGDYAFTIHAPGLHRFHRPDETELWIQDDLTGGWRLAQCTGNPNKSGGRTRIEAGVPRRFELWTMGRNQTVVDWEVTDFGRIDPATGRATLSLARQVVPQAAIGARTAAPDDPHGDGLLDSWKSRHGLDRKDAVGPNGPWGDPDGDGLLNWQEQLAGTDPMKADTEGRAGLVRWEVWRDIPGRYVFDLRRAGHFPTGPREVRFLDRLEIPTGTGNHYGSRVRGLLVAPEDGEYTFGISADDGAELWLGENESWQSKRRIAQADQHVAGQLRWFRRNEKGENVPLDSEQTARVTLKAGSRYYVEILHKQDSGPDHCAVSWIMPGAEKPQRIAKEHLVSWQPCPTDADDDGLPDDWQKAAGLMAAELDASLRHAEADPDGDGATNWEEWRAGTDPLSKADAPETGRMLTSEAWAGIPGHRISDLVVHPGFPAAPDFTTRVDNLDFGHQGENYGVRLRGYLTAPEDGIYHFAIAGNHSGILYLGETEHKFTKRVIARAEHGTDWRFFSSDPRQRGGPVELERGKRYYIEVIFKRGVAEATRRGDESDHSSVAWTRPGRKESVISPEYFSPYRPDPRDLDDDDLPDEWEKTHGLDPADPTGKNGSWGDPDGDGLENLREYQLGLDPNVGDVHGTPGLALWEYWDDREDLMPALRDEGGTLSERLWQDHRVPLDPVRREWRESLESPRGVGVNYASRMRAVIIAPETGDYVFAISSHHAGELFLSPDESKFKRRRIASIAWASRYREWHNHESQVSAPVRLEAGARYYIEALHAQGRNPLRWDHLCVAWQAPGSEKFEVIGSKHLVAFFRDPNDQDDDELPDDWEKRFGLDSSDPHGDNGPHGDPDRDGLTNLEEYHLGSDPRNGDTDGDGVSDHDEVHVYGSDPLNRDAVPAELLVDVPLESYQGQGSGLVIDHETGEILQEAREATASRWALGANGSLTSLERRGDLEYTFQIGRAGIHKIDLKGHAFGEGAAAVPLTILVDGIQIGTGEAMPGVRRNGLSWLTPWLEEGEHTVTILNHNVRGDVTLVIDALEILILAGEDSDRNGLPDWFEPALAKRNRITRPRIDSMTSPACIEGLARFLVDLDVAADGVAMDVGEGSERTWFCDIPLAEGRDTAVVATFEAGAITETYDLKWVETNLMDFADEPLQVRQGDALRLSAWRASERKGYTTFRISHDEMPLHEGPASQAFVHRFEENGTSELHVEVLERGIAVAELRIEVRAVGVDLGPDFHVPSNDLRVWTPPAFDEDALLEADPAITIRRLDGQEGRQSFDVGFSQYRSARGVAVARLGEEGPVMDSVVFHGFFFAPSTWTRQNQQIRTLADGTRVYSVAYIIDGFIPEDLSIWLMMHVPGVMFENGDTWHELTAADFDENGKAELIFLKSPNSHESYICHAISLYGESPATEPDDAAEPASEAGVLEEQ